MEITLTVEITAAEFRRLNSFEWAVLSLLDTFGENAPDLADATIQLCIGEPAFLLTALENLRAVSAVQPKDEGASQSDLSDYNLSQAGKIIFGENGWETGAEENLTEDITLDWPSLAFHPPSKPGQGTQTAPSPDEVQQKMTPAKIEDWLNRNNLRCWRVKSFYVAKVEG